MKMAQEEQSAPADAERPNFWLIAVLVIAVIGALYWFFLRTVWVPVLVTLRLNDVGVTCWGSCSIRPTPALKPGNGAGSV